MKTPNPKSQIPNKLQISNSKKCARPSGASGSGAWNLEFVWDLGFEIWSFTRLAILFFIISTCAASAQSNLRWWKGNLHTHTLWSDGDDFPEMVVDWYKARGYDFLALSDHNTLQEGEFGVVATNTAIARLLPRYTRRFGPEWITRGQGTNGTPLILLKTLAEFRGQFEAPGRFLLIPAEEVTDKFGRWPIHLIASGVQEYIKPRGGNSPVDVIQRNFAALQAQRERTGVPMMMHLAHPNFGWAITAEDMIQLRAERFFEVYNGHPLVHNDGDATHASTERMWDIVNTHRIAERRDLPLLGLAVDDSHHYGKFSPTNSNSGRGWVMVRAAQLTAAAIINALEAGNFYASSGVELNDVTWKENKLTLRIVPQPGVTFTTEFIGTRRPVDWQNKTVMSTNGHPLAVTRLYSRGIGAVLSEQRGTNVSYQTTGDELFVRARVTSSRLKENGVEPGERERAWTQPVRPGK